MCTNWQLTPDLPAPIVTDMWPWAVVFTAMAEVRNCARKVNCLRLPIKSLPGKNITSRRLQSLSLISKHLPILTRRWKNYRRLYDEALAQEDVIGLSIGTRPDCLGPDVIELLSGYAKKYHIWVELGLQSVHDKTLQFINRGHNYQQFLDAVNALTGSGLNICVHIIIGLPGESDEDVLTTARTLAALPINGIKIHSLLALEGTALGEMYKKGTISMITKEKYVSLVVDVLEILPPEMVIQRLTADGYRDIFLAPDWAMNKLDVLNSINKELKRRDSYQGRYYKG